MSYFPEFLYKNKPQNLAKNESNQKQKEKIERMFKKIQTTVFQLIQYLNTIYDENNVNYSIDQYYSTLLRIFCPYQILSYHHLDGSKVHAYDYYSKQGQLPKENGQKISTFKNKQPSEIIIQYPYKPTNRELTHLNVTQSHAEQLNEQLSSKQMKRMMKIRSKLKQDPHVQGQKNYLRYYRKSGRPKGLISDLEQKLCQWIISEIQQGNTIYREHIGQKAKELSVWKDFRGSLGWVDKFIRRNPQIKKYITKRVQNISCNVLKASYKGLSKQQVQKKAKTEQQQKFIRYCDKVEKKKQTKQRQQNKNEQIKEQESEYIYEQDQSYRDNNQYEDYDCGEDSELSNNNCQNSLQNEHQDIQ